MRHVLVTGGTGLIGRYLLRDLLISGVPVVALARSGKNTSSQARIDDIIDDWEISIGRKLPRPLCFDGDLHQPGLGLAPDERAWIGEHCGEILHNAGNVMFHGSAHDGEPWRTNVHGTRHLVELAQELHIEEFHYVSTAYVCGNRNGEILENQLDRGQSFDSQYEHSKFTAESLVREAGFAKLNVYRPGSVTGDWRQGYTSTYHGVYLVAQFTYMAQQRAGVSPGVAWHHPVRLFQTGEETHHLTPVNAVSSAIVDILLQRDLRGNTYHLTPVKPCTGAQLESALARYFHYHGVRFVGPCTDRQESMNEIEQLFYDVISSAQHRYFHGDPAFDCSNTLRDLPEWSELQIDEDYLLRIFHFAVDRRFGRRPSPKIAVPVT